LANRLEKKNIYIAPAKDFFIDNNSKENSFRICVSKIPVEKIKIGIPMIFEEIKKMGKN
jgi:DNA-binding transcriptional MocR family regulator